MTTLDFITALFYEVDEQLRAIPKHPEAHLWPSEVVSAATRNCRETARGQWSVRPCCLRPPIRYVSPASVCFALLPRALCRPVCFLPRPAPWRRGRRRGRPRRRPLPTRTGQHGQTGSAPAPRPAPTLWRQARVPVWSKNPKLA